jgi:tetratricopeptide (TPR) repeat protein
MALRIMIAEEFARRLQDASKLQDTCFALFLGAGCSITSGIPGAATLVEKHWLPKLRDLCAPNEKDLVTWAMKKFPKYDPNNPAGSYGLVMEELFVQSEERQREIERLCEGKFPGFGYAVLATLIVHEGGCFSVVITTNFDDLVSDALYLFTQARPLVIGHESLAGFIRPTRTRPLVVKLHGDAHLAPQNTAAETCKIQEEVERQVSSLLHDRGLIVMGYGGNDQGIADLLSALPKDALPYGIYWVNGSEPQGVLRPWLEERNAIWVEKFDFDEMMLLIRDAFKLPHPDDKPFVEVFKQYYEKYNRFSERIRSAFGDLADEALKKAVDRADSEMTDWYSDLTGWLSFLLRAQKLERMDPEGAKYLYQEGIQNYPNSAQLLGAYALFLEQECKEHDLAEQFYLRAFSADSHHINTLVNYAGFLLSCEKKKEGSQLLEKAISLLPYTESQTAAVEIWFYAFAHWPIENRSAALTKLKKALREGNRSHGRELSANIAQARKDNHPDIEWLEKLAAVINEEVNISILDEWDRWKDS